MNEPIQDKAPKPPGLLPKHLQSWLIVGLAVLMVLIMWLTGPKKPLSTVKSGTPVLPSPLADVSEGKITELQKRIEQLQREQLVAQNALAQQSRVLAGGTAETMPPSAPTPAAGTERAEDPIEAERRKRDYLSLFASNVALTYRKNTPVGAGPTNSESNSAGALPPLTEAASLAQILKTIAPPAPTAVTPQPPSPNVARSTESAAEPEPEKKEVNHPAASLGRPASATGKSYVVFEGSVLESVLVNRLDGALAGPIQCLTTTDTYSHDRQHLLIPTGSRLLGETRKVEVFGATRLAVIFHRLIMPDGYSVNLDQFKGLNQAGDVGLRDKVNNHYAQIFGASLALGALGAVAEAGTGSVFTENGADRMREGFATSTAQSSQQILDKFLNILPTITIREGHRVKVYLAGDLTLPAYSNHNLPSDL